MLTLLYGEDSFSSQKKLHQITNDFSKNNPEATLVVFDAEETEFAVGDLKGVVRTDGLFSDKKVVVLKNFLLMSGKDEQDDWFDFLQKNRTIFSGDELLLVMWENGNPRKNNKLFKFLKEQAGDVAEFVKMNNAQLKRSIEEEVLANGRQISSQAIDKIILWTRGDLWKVNNELAKLFDFCRAKKIEEKDVEIVVNPDVEANIFETIEALSAGNKKKALKLLQNQLQQGDDPFYVLSMYVYQFRNLLKIAGFYFQGITGQYEIAKLAKIHPFVAQKGIAQLRNLQPTRLKEIYQMLEEIDQKAKTGKADPILLLDLFIVQA